jgi:putative bacteriocin precursor
MMKKLVKPVMIEERSIIAYTNENCNGANCSSGCGGGGSDKTAYIVAGIGAGAAIAAACIGALCT